MTLIRMWACFAVFFVTSYSVQTQMTRSLGAINVVYTVDNASAKHFLLSLSSIATFTGCYRPILVHCFISATSDQSASDLINKLQSCNMGMSCLTVNYIKYIHTPTNSSSGASPHWQSVAERLRNDVPELLPDVRKYIYLDNDVIITRHGILPRLWNQDVSQHPVGLVTNRLHLPEAEQLIHGAFDYKIEALRKGFQYTGPLMKSGEHHNFPPYICFIYNSLLFIMVYCWAVFIVCL
jgi:lipopolysaccharide biosynthesis glycosyltransferase